MKEYICINQSFQLVANVPVFAYTEAESLKDALETFRNAWLEASTHSEDESFEPYNDPRILVLCREPKLKLGDEDYNAYWINAITGDIYVNNMFYIET